MQSFATWHAVAISVIVLAPVISLLTRRPDGRASRPAFGIWLIALWTSPTLLPWVRDLGRDDPLAAAAVALWLVVCLAVPIYGFHLDRH